MRREIRRQYFTITNGQDKDEFFKKIHMTVENDIFNELINKQHHNLNIFICTEVEDGNNDN